MTLKKTVPLEVHPPRQTKKKKRKKRLESSESQCKASVE